MNSYTGGYNFTTGGTDTISFTTDSDATTTAVFFPDPLIDWLPNSCLHEKYVPTWHLVRSYRN